MAANKIQPWLKLWKTDDAEWMRHRDKLWDVLFENIYKERPNDEVRRHKNFFLTGEKSDYIPEPAFFSLTPLTKAEEAKAFFESENFSASGRNRLLSAYLDQSIEYAVADFYRQHIKLYVDGVLGHEYRVIKEKEGPYLETEISPNPASWCKNFCSAGLRVLNGKLPYHGMIECIDYFLSALEYASDTYHRKYTHLDELMNAAAEYLESSDNDSAFTEFARMLKANETLIYRNWAQSGNDGNNREQ